MEWFKDYLLSCYHRVKSSATFFVMATYEGWHTPVQGPLLFLIYMNSLPAQVDSGLFLQYADDTTIICATSTAVQTTISSQLLLIQQYIDFTE